MGHIQCGSAPIDASFQWIRILFHDYHSHIGLVFLLVKIKAGPRFRNLMFVLLLLLRSFPQ